jgi:hypothetical protein
MARILRQLEDIGLSPEPQEVSSAGLKRCYPKLRPAHHMREMITVTRTTPMTRRKRSGHHGHQSDALAFTTIGCCSYHCETVSRRRFYRSCQPTGRPKSKAAQNQISVHRNSRRNCANRQPVVLSAGRRRRCSGRSSVGSPALYRVFQYRAGLGVNAHLVLRLLVADNKRVA